VSKEACQQKPFEISASRVVIAEVASSFCRWRNITHSGFRIDFSPEAYRGNDGATVEARVTLVGDNSMLQMQMSHRKEQDGEPARWVAEYITHQEWMSSVHLEDGAYKFYHHCPG
jgi:hypothetical protein